jgi:hypothetical protein
MTSPTTTPVDRTPRLLYFGLFVLQYLLYATLRSGMLDTGLYVGFRQPSATSPHAWAIFVQYWNHAMMYIFPVLVLGFVAFMFGRITIVSLSRFSRGRRLALTSASSFNLGVRGFLVPSVVAYALTMLFRAPSHAGLLPFIVDGVIFMSYSRVAMWKSLMARTGKESRKAG